MAYIIGIGGSSRSGKSHLADLLKDFLPEKKVLVLSMDDFVFEESKIPKIKNRTNWEVLESTDFEKLRNTINKEQAHFDLIIVEGILAFANKDLLSYYDYTVWLQISKKTFLERRKKETRWGDEPDWYLEHVWESYLRYGHYPQADFITSGEVSITNQVLDEILKKV